MTKLEHSSISCAYIPGIFSALATEFLGVLLDNLI